MEEKWKPIEGFEGKYDISSFGRVRSYMQTKDGNILKLHIDGKGYPQVRLYYAPMKSKMFKVHRLVGMAFIDNPNGYKEINHKDENKLNNHVNNLEWCSSAYNHNYGTRNIRASLSNRCCPTTSKKVYSVDLNGNVKYYNSIGEAERQTGISHSNIVRALKERTWKAGGYEWYYYAA